MPSTDLSLHYRLVFGTKDRMPPIEATWRLRTIEFSFGVPRWHPFGVRVGVEPLPPVVSAYGLNHRLIADVPSG